jgi:hypothetical protein
VTGTGDDTGPGGGGGGGGAANPELTISGGGTSMVATDVVFAQVATLRLLQGEAEGWREQIGRVQDSDPGMALGWLSGDLGASLLAAFVAVIDVADSCRELADSLVEAAEQYGRLETGLDGSLRAAGSWLAHTLGVLRPLAPLVALSLATPLAYLAVTSLISNAVLGRGTTVVPPGVADWLADNPQSLTSPVTTALVRVLVSSADDAVLGGLGVPYPVAAALGDDGAGLLGTSSSAFGVLVAARAAGLLRETPVRVRRVGGSAAPAPRDAALRRRNAAGWPFGGSFGAASLGGGSASPQRGSSTGRARGTPTDQVPGLATGRPSSPATGSRPGPPARPAPGESAGPRHGGAVAPAPRPEVVLQRPTPPTGFADLADRIPTEEDGGQVRIERYGDPAHPSWLLYLGGTLEWSPTGSTEPWDLTSNLTAVADQEAGSYRAVLQALQAAGVQPGDPVLPVAHSQGGLLAAELAARGDINAAGLVTFGAPAGQVAVPADLPAIAIEHTDDIIPALGGTAADDDGRVYVRRELFAGIEVPRDSPLPAHQLVGYRETASLVDASLEPRLVAFRATLGGVVGTTPGEQSVWSAERVQ